MKIDKHQPALFSDSSTTRPGGPLAKPPPLSPGGLVAALSKLAVNRPAAYDWKSDYARALEEKYARVR